MSTTTVLLSESVEYAARHGYHFVGLGPAARAAHVDWFRSITKLWHDHNDHSIDGLFAWEPSIQGETLLCGTPARVREQMAQLLEVSGCNYVICAFAWGTLPQAQTQRSLRPFAEEVMPAFAGSGAPMA